MAEPVDPAAWIDLASGQPIGGAPLGMLLSAQAAATPDRPAFTLGETSLSFAAFDRRANRRARHLIDRGIAAGDRVILAMANRPDYLECAFALWKIGATPCPVSERLAPAEFAEIVTLAEPRAVIGASGLAVDAPRLYAIDDPLPDDIDDSPLPPAVATPGKIANSGGSTGRPKLIVDPLASVWGPDKEGCRRGPRLTMLNPGPLYHSAPFNTTTMALAQGTHIVCLGRFDPQDWLDAVERHGVDYAYMVPTMMARIARLPITETERRDLSAIRTLLHMAAPCPPEIKRWWINRIGAERVWEVYGGTERIGVTMIGGDEWLRHPDTVGKASPGQEILITDEDGTPLPTGTIGEIHFRKTGGAPASYAYIGAAGRTKGDIDSFGDMGWLDEAGYLHIADRRTDMVLVGGINIYPAEIEAAIEALPGVRGCAVIGLPDADMGNRLHAIIEVVSPDDVPEDLGAFLAPLADRLPALKRPRSTEFTLHPIRDEAGKVRRSALREERLRGSE
nr:AMP-binding protein [Sphingomonas sp. Y57]